MTILQDRTLHPNLPIIFNVYKSYHSLLPVMYNVQCAMMHALNYSFRLSGLPVPMEAKCHYDQFVTVTVL